MLLLLKDVLVFFKDHWWALAKLLLPITLVSIALMELSQFNQLFEAGMINQQDIQVENSQSIETEEAADQPPADGQSEPPATGQPFWQNLDLSLGQIIGIFLYVASTLVPTALIIIYVQAQLSNNSKSLGLCYQQGIALWLQLLKFYGLVFTAMFVVFSLVVFLPMALGLSLGALQQFLEFVLPLIMIYLVYRLAFAPYLMADQRLDVQQTFRASWLSTGPYMAKLIMGSLFIFMIIFMINNLILSVLSGVVSNDLVKESLVFYLGQLLGAVHTIYFYRVYSLSQEASNEAVD